MPIHPRHRGLYPFDWRQLSASIRFRRADGRCERCGRPTNRVQPRPLAGARRRDIGWLDRRLPRPRAAQVHSFTCEGCTGEFVRALRDEGGWSLRFGPGCQRVEPAVADLDEACAA